VDEAIGRDISPAGVPEETHRAGDHAVSEQRENARASQAQLACHQESPIDARYPVRTPENG
jgi:hypothetical protein